MRRTHKIRHTVFSIIALQILNRLTRKKLPCIKIYSQQAKKKHDPGVVLAGSRALPIVCHIRLKNDTMKLYSNAQPAPPMFREERIAFYILTVGGGLFSLLLELHQINRQRTKDNKVALIASFCPDCPSIEHCCPAYNTRCEWEPGIVVKIHRYDTYILSEQEIHIHRCTFYSNDFSFRQDGTTAEPDRDCLFPSF